MNTITIPSPVPGRDHPLMLLHYLEDAKGRLTHLRIPGFGEWTRSFPTTKNASLTALAQYYKQAQLARIRPGAKLLPHEQERLDATGYRATNVRKCLGRRNEYTHEKMDTAVREVSRALNRSQWAKFWIVDEMIRGLRRGQMFPFEQYWIVDTRTWTVLKELYPTDA